ncbi:C-C chemokine receptor type 5 [Brienomyrus brachyistius]|uniref:C-C chemokine receptor type 5 n=1 Tax=Brienomyrus brachyistius TaxID=42636 RepID=UPI0020B2D46D|nr:C-C chemokine receptor type 5 [Brienomyrus brachyistius]XP_048882231.1 C-C chemokine receptor type 5 [Brienomyrus brachyistius]XP_048882232.1 C-C chemokine receptor type 5 [Brienomyrus brachyistius]XP_048882233.1 C-C chemokine receptor type 5 [Brienomyrus brachyistius]XP_048882234.1 C-C chemokine receptor type 5 [Brienomyrus brachyistius]XP_048882235.1 C-C chemokine receptor type 5 [Brienomyrus brachyistius]
MDEVRNFSDSIMAETFTGTTEPSNYDSNDSSTVTTIDYYFYSADVSDCNTNGSANEMVSFQPILFSVVFVLGFAGNSTVIWILVKLMKLKSVSDICLLNLAVSDLTVTLSLPIWAYYTPAREPTSHVLCKAMVFIYQIGFYSGILFVTLMGIDRYLAIVHAVATMRVRTVRNGTVVSAVIWMVSILSALPETIFYSISEEEKKCMPIYPNNSENTWKLFQNIRENAVGLFISLPIMMFCYVSILAVLIRSRNSKKHRAMRLIFTIALLFAVFWVPYNIVIFLKSLQVYGFLNNCESSQGINLALGATETIALIHCCVNPIIYAFVGEKFRKNLIKELSRFPLCRYLCKLQPVHIKNSENDTSNTSA